MEPRQVSSGGDGYGNIYVELDVHWAEGFWSLFYYESYKDLRYCPEMVFDSEFRK